MDLKKFRKFGFIQVVLAIILYYFFIKNKSPSELLNPPKTVNHIELTSFMGHWYEIASIIGRKIVFVLKHIINLIQKMKKCFLLIILATAIQQMEL